MSEINRENDLWFICNQRLYGKTLFSKSIAAKKKFMTMTIRWQFQAAGDRAPTVYTIETFKS